MTAKVPAADAPAELKEGVQVQLSNGLQATVAEVTPEHVIIDANHVLAGKDLNFEVELIKLQKVYFFSSHTPVASWFKVCRPCTHSRSGVQQSTYALAFLLWRSCFSILALVYYYKGYLPGSCPQPL